jgi:Tfp pilus assembly protein PilX
MIAKAAFYHRKTMKMIQRNNGSVLLIVIFAIALLSAVTVGILQMHTEEIQLMQNQVNAAQALATAEAGLNDAFARIRGGNDPNIASTSFNGGTYAVTAEASAVSDLLLTSTGTSSQGFVARAEADITVGSSSPYVIRIDRLRINE